MPGEERPAPTTRLGRWVADVRGAFAGPPGRRAYDRKRISLLVILMVVVQLGAQGATSVIRQQFQAQDKLLTTLVDQQRADREQKERQHSELLAEMRAVRCSTLAAVAAAICDEHPKNPLCRAQEDCR
jgi:hypothetical protein